MGFDFKKVGNWDEEGARWFRERLFQLRINKNVTAREMSLSLGQSESYVNKIENGKALPSMQGLFIICDYLGITPSNFFDEFSTNPVMDKRFIEEFHCLDDNKKTIILGVMEEFNKSDEQLKRNLLPNKGEQDLIKGTFQRTDKGKYNYEMPVYDKSISAINGVYDTKKKTVCDGFNNSLTD